MTFPPPSRTHNEVFVNCGGARAMRAPGHPQGCALMEAAMDDLADKLGIDPLEFRLKNLAAGDFRTPIYEGEVKMGAELIGWREKRKPRGQNGRRPDPPRPGHGPAPVGRRRYPGQEGHLHDQPRRLGRAQVRHPGHRHRHPHRSWRSSPPRSSGLKPTDIISNIGNSTLPAGPALGRLDHHAPRWPRRACDAVTKARDAMFKKIAPAVQAAAEDLSTQGRPALRQGRAGHGLEGSLPQARHGARSPRPASAAEGLSSVGVGGCQFAEVTVDIETGVVRVKKIVAIQDSGLIIDRLTWESQVYGGVIMGLNYGLFEERIMDPDTGVMLNPDMELYKLAGASDIPEIVVRAYDPPDQKARGVIGVGEPPTIATAAAIANAVTNAIGVRVPEWPMTPRNVLNALATASKEGKA